MWILIIIVLLFIYFSMKSKSTKNTKQVQTTRNAEPAKQAEKQKKKYDAETERLFQIAINELKEYQKIRSPILKQWRSSSSFEFQKERYKKMAKESTITHKKLAKTHDYMLQQLTKKALEALEKYKKLDPETKGKFIRKYMASEERKSFEKIAEIVRRGLPESTPNLANAQLMAADAQRMALGTIRIELQRLNRL